MRMRTSLWGTGGGLCLLKGKLDNTFFLSNCDILLDADYGDILNYHKSQGNIITMVCAVKHFTVPYGVIELNNDGTIQTMREKPEMNFLTNTGVYVVEPRVVEELEDGKKQGFTDIIEHYRRIGRKGGRVPHQRAELDGHGPDRGAGSHAPPAGRQQLNFHKTVRSW